jgi:dihydrofolate reductase
MGSIAITEFISLDGVIEDPGGAEQYEHGGWSFEIQRGPAGDKFKLDEAMAAVGLLLGRVTYDGFAKAWPSMTGPFADKFNGMPKYVVSGTLHDPSWNNTTVISPDDFPGAVAKLREETDGELTVHGSATLARSLLENDLVDELRLMVYPVLLGQGKRLFDGLTGKRPLKLAESRTVGEGVEIQVYRTR